MRVGLGDAAAAARVRAVVERWSGRWANCGTAALGLGLVDLALARADALLGDHDAARARFAAAASGHERLGTPAWLARTLVHQSRFLAATGRADDAAAGSVAAARAARARRPGTASPTSWPSSTPPEVRPLDAARQVGAKRRAKWAGARCRRPHRRPRPREAPVPATSPAVPDLTRYRLIHKALRTTDDRLVAALAATAPTDLDRARAIERWFADYVGELTHHHAVEDEIFFPALAARVPSHAQLAPSIDVDHHRTDELLAAASAPRSARWTGGGPPPSRDGEALVLAGELRDLLDAHLDLEDADVLPLFERHFSKAEYDAMDEAALKSLLVRPDAVHGAVDGRRPRRGRRGHAPRRRADPAEAAVAGDPPGLRPPARAGARPGAGDGRPHRRMTRTATTLPPPGAASTRAPDRGPAIQASGA